MNLLRKKKKDVPKVYYKTCTATCPVCKKEHEVHVCTWAQCYLDGTPIMTLEQFYSRFVICEQCGYVFNVLQGATTLSDAGYATVPLVQAAAQHSYPNEIAKKRALLDIRYNQAKNPSWIDLHEACESRDNTRATQIMELMLDAPNPFERVMGCDSFYEFDLPGQFFFQPEYATLDYLRRLGRFNEAKELLKQLSAEAQIRNNEGLRRLLNKQKQLIRKKDTIRH